MTFARGFEGDVPHIQVWMNRHQSVDWTASENDSPEGAIDGMIAVAPQRPELHHEGNRAAFAVSAISP